MINEKGAIRCLLELTRTLLEGVGLERALQEVCRAALELLPGNHASVRILDESGTRLLCGARAGSGAENKPVSFRKGEGAIGWVVANRQAICIEDARQDRRFKRGAGQGFDILSLLAVPLWCGGRVVGVLGVTAAEPGSFGPEQEDRALLLANCASPYIEKARMERLSITDPETMAFNEGYLVPRLREEFERARRHETRVSLVVLEVEGLDRVRERHGEEVMLRAMQQTADRVRASVRLSDILVRRGERMFALITPDMALSPASQVADRIRHSLTEYPLEVVSGQPLPLKAQLGVACWNGSESPEELIGRADTALDEARMRGGGLTVRARHFHGRQLDAATELRCLREGCGETLDEIRGNGPTYYRCRSAACRSIWFFGNLD